MRCLSIWGLTASIALGLGSFAPRALQARPACSLTAVQGDYGFIVNGTGVPTDPPSPIPFLGPLVGVGISHFDGKGNLTLMTEKLNVNGEALDTSFTGTYQINPDCSGEMIATSTLTGTTNTYSIAVTAYGNEVLLVQKVPTSPVVAATFKKLWMPATTRPGGSCTPGSLRGEYAFAAGGSNPQVSPPSAGAVITPLLSVGAADFDGRGGGSLTETANAVGSVAERTATIAYTINPDCTGVMSVTTTSSGAVRQLNFVLVSLGKEILFIQTDPASDVLSGRFQKASVDRIGPAPVRGRD
ncbi:hypothetical protein [Gloeobacter morelensis]|uniref:Uncharacterized protein n=1 Tax=Gloeobacter morelensis MG652769 TaxID=2781736 RepID=A0ABY3PH01_9CYAN|nr:hypothetical protein [Gloeobacter morelensis]UFP92935.1 hypothetical protein ISF26_14035 [Gloeobacter morelensis MG652769]